MSPIELSWTAKKRISFKIRMQDNQTVDNQYHTRLKTNSNLIFFKKVTLFTEKYTEQLPYNVTPLIHNPERGLRVRNLPDRESVTCSVKRIRRR